MTQPIRIIKPTRQRRQHGPIVRAERTQDVDGNPGLPWHAVPLLTQWERNGTITPEMRVAGDRFHDLFYLAHLDPLRASDMNRAGGGGAAAVGHSVETSKNKIHHAMMALGGRWSPAGSCVWSVLGSEKSLRQWSATSEWRGRSISQHVAKGILIGALGVLVTFSEKHPKFNI